MIQYFMVSGRVQGVFYRASTRDKAKKLQLTGWVRNLSNGDVELVACGEKVNILALEKWLWQGPMFAKVTDVVSETLIDASIDEAQRFVVREDGGVNTELIA